MGGMEQVIESFVEDMEGSGVELQGPVVEKMTLTPSAGADNRKRKLVDDEQAGHGHEQDEEEGGGGMLRKCSREDDAAGDELERLRLRGGSGAEAGHDGNDVDDVLCAEKKDESDHRGRRAADNPSADEPLEKRKENNNTMAEGDEQEAATHKVEGSEGLDDGDDDGGQSSAESSASSSPASASPDTERVMDEEAEDERRATEDDGDDEQREDQEKRDNGTDESSSKGGPPSPPPLPRHRHRPSAGARRTFDNLADSASTTTHRCTVIAAVVVFDGEGRVLLVQEAKSKCRGRWYLPAGRVEVGESPLEGAMREVEEESGLHLEPTGIFSVEYKINKNTGKAWIRYGVTGQIVGGSLKTPDREDKESIQAQWFPLSQVNSSQMSLRNEDMLKLIDLFQKNGDRPIPVLSSYK